MPASPESSPPGRVAPPAGTPTVEIEPREVERTALAVDGVSALHGGPFGEIASYLPGGRVNGVRLTNERAEVHVVVADPATVLAVADAVRDAVETLLQRPVDVTVEDVGATTGTDRDMPPNRDGTDMTRKERTT